MSGANVSPIGRNKEEWLVQATDYRKLNEPPRPRLQRNGTIYLMAWPPLLCQGGDFAFPAGCPRRPCPADDLWVTLKHHCKEGWPSDSENIAKHPLIARPGWFSDESKRKTTPAASAWVASPNFL